MVSFWILLSQNHLFIGHYRWYISINLLSSEYWIDDDCYVGRIKEIPGVFSQGKSLDELKKNIKEAYHLMME